jgi:hypothetical protein
LRQLQASAESPTEAIKVVAEKADASVAVVNGVTQGIEPTYTLGLDTSNNTSLTAYRGEFEIIPQGVLLYTDGQGNAQVEVVSTQVTAESAEYGVMQDATGDVEVEDNRTDALEIIGEEPGAVETPPVEDLAESVRRAAEEQKEVGSFGQKLMGLLKS